MFVRVGVRANMYTCACMSECVRMCMFVCEECLGMEAVRLMCLEYVSCACVHACMHTCMRTCAHAYMCTMHTCIVRTAVHAYMRTTYVHVHFCAGAGFMNRRRLCQLTAAILTSDLTTHMWVL